MRDREFRREWKMDISRRSVQRCVLLVGGVFHPTLCLCDVYVSGAVGMLFKLLPVLHISSDHRRYDRRDQKVAPCKLSAFRSRQGHRLTWSVTWERVGVRVAHTHARIVPGHMQ